MKSIKLSRRGLASPDQLPLGVVEISSDHALISFNIEMAQHTENQNLSGTRYIVKHERYGIFDEALIYNLSTAFKCESNVTDLHEIDNEMEMKINLSSDTEEVTQKLNSCIKAACNKAFYLSPRNKIPSKGKTVPW